MHFFLFLSIGAGNQGVGGSCLVFISGIKLNFLSGKRLFFAGSYPPVPTDIPQEILDA